MHKAKRIQQRRNTKRLQQTARRRMRDFKKKQILEDPDDTMSDKLTTRDLVRYLYDDWIPGYHRPLY